MPDGFDDPQSDFYVPPELRPYWPTDPGFAVDAMVDERLVGWAREDIGSDRYLELEAAGEAGRMAQIPQYWGDRNSGWRSGVPRGGRLVALQRLGAIDEETLPKPNHPQQVPELQRARWIHLLATAAAVQQLQAVQQGEQIAAERAAAEARWTAEHTCELCQDVKPTVKSVVITSAGQAARVDPDCRAVLRHRWVTRLAGRDVNGRGLVELADAWLDSPPPAQASSQTVGEMLAQQAAEEERRRLADPAKATFGERRIWGGAPGTSAVTPLVPGAPDGPVRAWY